MKKSFTFFMAVLLILTLSGCAYLKNHSPFHSQDSVGNRPVKEDVAIGDKISGSSSSTRVFKIFKFGLPEEYAEGANHVINESSGNRLDDPFSAEKKAAVYDAVNRSNAEFIVDPEFTVEEKNYFLFSKVKITVNGYKNKHIIARSEEPASSANVVSASKPEQSAPAEAAVSPVTKEPEVPKAVVSTPKEEVPVTPQNAAAEPVVTEKQSIEQIDTKSATEEAIKNRINKWRDAWQSGDMETYRSCYAPEFNSKGKDLNKWISYKEKLQKRSKNITIGIDNLKITLNDADVATAVFTQNYSSSILKDSGEKILRFIKINNEWKISEEIM